ncbi:hypothetical protein JCM18901_1773 [Psychrobacter sp. JCM 18901]|nr:hypothetical protein JCM18901_1773 [Psychrobacter sp. JCM 18901]
MTILRIKPTEPAPSAKNIQKVPARPASDVLEISHIIKKQESDEYRQQDIQSPTGDSTGGNSKHGVIL